MKTKVISAHGWFNAEKDDVILYDKWQAYLNYPHKDDSHADDDLWELVNGSIKFNADLHERVSLEGERMSKETVTITKEEYENLQERDDFLCALEICGVDNWVGYDEAHKLFREWCSEVTDE